jgi:hypothetical protein
MNDYLIKYESALIENIHEIAAWDKHTHPLIDPIMIEAPTSFSPSAP